MFNRWSRDKHVIDNGTWLLCQAMFDSSRDMMMMILIGCTCGDCTDFM